MVRFVIIFIIGFSWALSAQEQEEEWVKILGDDRHNVVYDLIETYDNGYLLGGLIYNNSGQQVTYGIIIKTDINGNVLWEKMIGADPPPGNTGGSFIKPTPDGGVILTGATLIYDNYYDAFVLKLNACGEKEWSRIFYNMGSTEFGAGIEIMNDSTYLAMIKYWGNDLANERIWLFKIDQEGEIIWQKVYAKWTLGTNNEEGRHLLKNQLNEYLITGDYYQYNPDSDTNHRFDRPMYIMIDSLGNEQWHLLWGVNEYFYGLAGKSVFSAEGNIYSVGQNASYFQEGYQGAMFKLDSDGNQLFSKNVPDSTMAGISTTISLMQDSILFIGTSWTDWDENEHTSIYKTDTLGNILKEKELLQESNTFNSSLITHDNKYLVTGSFVVDGNWDIYLWKFNRDLEYDSIYTQPRIYDSLCDHEIVSDTIDLDTTTVNLHELYKQMHRIKVHPNPANTKLVITLGALVNGTELKLYNTTGRLVKQILVQPYKREYKVDVSGLPAGLYVVVLEDEGKAVDKEKVIVAE